MRDLFPTRRSPGTVPTLIPYHSTQVPSVFCSVMPLLEQLHMRLWYASPRYHECSTEHGLIGPLVSKVSLGEMMSYLPIAGGHITMAERYVSKGFSFLLGWNYWYNWTIILPAELRFVRTCAVPLPILLTSVRSAAAILIGYWDEKTSPAVWITVCMVVVVLINMLGAGMCFAPIGGKSVGAHQTVPGAYGEAEFVFA